MGEPLLSRRRSLGLGLAAAASTLLPAGGAMAQPASQGRDWFALIREHHHLIELGFSQLLAAKDFTPKHALVGMRNLDYQLRAHSFAEELTIYPAMTQAGMKEQADQLYQEEAHNHVLLWPLDVQMREGHPASQWKEQLAALRDSVVRHAKQHEEQEQFPALREKLDASQNALLTKYYPLQFASVLPFRMTPRATGGSAR